VFHESTADCLTVDGGLGQAVQGLRRGITKFYSRTQAMLVDRSGERGALLGGDRRAGLPELIGRGAMGPEG